MYANSKAMTTTCILQSELAVQQQTEDSAWVLMIRTKLHNRCVLRHQNYILLIISSQLWNINIKVITASWVCLSKPPHWNCWYSWNYDWVDDIAINRLRPINTQDYTVLMDAYTTKVTTSIQGGSSRISTYFATSSQVGNNTKIKWSLEYDEAIIYLHDGIDASCNITESIYSNVCPTLLMITWKALLYASECHRATDACRTTKFIRLFTTLQPIFQSSSQPLHNSATTPNQFKWPLDMSPPCYQRE